MKAKISHNLLQRVDNLEQEIEQLKRDIIRSLATSSVNEGKKPSLFGSVEGGDITEEMIEESKRALFRNLKDI